jgi:hypothetical protein
VVKVENSEKGPTFLQIAVSIMASFFGVQSSKNHHRDFEGGKPLHFIIIGILMTFLLCCTIYFVVNVLVLN